MHFLAVGALLFAVAATLDRAEGTSEDRRIIVTEQDIERMRALWARQRLRPPTDAELRGLIESHIRNEVFYRRARALGLDRNDVIVQRRLVQKLDQFIAYSAVSDKPDDELLRAYLARHSDRYRRPDHISFTHIYFSRDKRGDDARANARAVLATLTAASDPPARAPERGDPFMLSNDYARIDQTKVARVYGAAFAKAVFAIKGERWSGPVVSPYGIHLVRVTKREPGRAARLDEVRQQVLRDYLDEARRAAKRKVYRKLRAQYEISVETKAGLRRWESAK